MLQGSASQLLLLLVQQQGGVVITGYNAIAVCVNSVCNAHTHTQGQELFESMMYCEPSQRISCAQALNHPYFEDIDAETRKLSTY
jgi:hypothetical protein